MSSNLSLITTFLLLLAAAIGGGAVALRLRLPMIIGYIAGGIAVGSFAHTFIDSHLVSLISESGITLLLFALGIEFSFHKLRSVLSVIAWPAVAQILLTFIAVFSLLTILAIPYLPGLYLAAAAALSSTAIVVKMLSERGELDTAPGELTTGWLVVQDLAVIPILILLTAVSGSAESAQGLTAMFSALGLAMLKAVVSLGLVLTVGRFGIPKLLSAVAAIKSRELLLLTTIGIVFFVGMVMYIAGLSVALGAFLAGLLVAETSQNHAVFAEIRPLRDLFVVVFFVSIGMSLPLVSVMAVWHIVLLVSAAVIVVKGGIIYTLLRFMRYHRKTAFMVGLHLTQVSEFGFVLAGAGLATGAMSTAHAAVLISVTFATIIISAPFISRSQQAYSWFNRFMKPVPKLFSESGQHAKTGDVQEGYPIQNHVVICGYGRVGKYIGRALLMANIPFLVVDYNQSVLTTLRQSGTRTVYGDPAEKDVLDYAQVYLARAVVVAIPDRHTQEMVIGNVLSLNRKVRIICRTHHEEDQRHLKSLGVHTVIQPEFEAAVTIVGKLLAAFGVPAYERSGKISRLKIEHGIG